MIYIMITVLSIMFFGIEKHNDKIGILGIFIENT